MSPAGKSMASTRRCLFV